MYCSSETVGDDEDEPEAVAVDADDAVLSLAACCPCPGLALLSRTDIDIAAATAAVPLLAVGLGESVTCERLAGCRRARPVQAGSPPCLRQKQRSTAKEPPRCRPISSSSLTSTCQSAGGLLQQRSLSPADPLALSAGRLSPARSQVRAEVHHRVQWALRQRLMRLLHTSRQRHRSLCSRSRF